MSLSVLPWFRSLHPHHFIHVNAFPLLQRVNGLNVALNPHHGMMDENLPRSELNGYSVNTIFSEGLLFAKKGPGTSARKHSKCITRKRMSRCGFLARVRTYNGRKILQRQRAKGRRFLGARLSGGNKSIYRDPAKADD